MSPIKLAIAGCLALTPLSLAYAQSQAVPQANSQSSIYELFKEKPWLTQQWEKADVSGDITLNPSLGPIDTSWKLARNVNPAFIKGAHQQLDAWSATISTNSNALKITNGPVSFSGDLGAQVTFSRIFESKANAAFSKPYTFWQKVPWTYQQAVESLKPGEAVRMELFMDLNGGVGSSQGVADYGGLGVGYNYTRGVRFLVDIYRLKNDRVRMRLVSQRNGGSSSTSASLNLLGGLSFGAGVVTNAIKRVFHVDSCNLAGFQINSANSDDPPVDTEMFDYVFNLQSTNDPQPTEAQLAYDLVMKSIGSFDYKEMFDPILIIRGQHAYSEKMSQQFQAALSPADQIFQKEKARSQGARSVDRWFRGVTRTAVNGQSAGTSCINLWNFNYNQSISKTLIKNYDRDDQLTYQIYENAATASTRSAAFGTWETTKRNSINTLFNADFESDKSFRETVLSDLIVSHDRQSKDFSPSDYQAVKENLAFTLPPAIYSAIDWGLFDKTSQIKKTNVSYHYDLIFHKESLAAMQSLSKKEIEEKLLTYAQNYPDSNWLDISPNQPIPSGKRASDENYNPPMRERFDYDIALLSRPLEIILSKDFQKATAEEKRELEKIRAREFEKIRNNVLFRQIGPGFMISLLPQDKAESLVAFRINLSGPAGMNVAKSIGSAGESKVYASIEYILRLLADRSFDLRLQVDATGNISPMSQKTDTTATPLQ